MTERQAALAVLIDRCDKVQAAVVRPHANHPAEWGAAIWVHRDLANRMAIAAVLIEYQLRNGGG